MEPQEKSTEIHIIPKGEEAEHYEDANCPCEPRPWVDGETGLMYWNHNITNTRRFFEGVFKV